VKRYQPPLAANGYDRYQLKLHEPNSDRLKEWADAVLFLNWEIMPTYTTGHDETLPEGVYDFTVADANEKQSQASGNPMIELELMVHEADGGTGIRVFDRLVFTPKAFWKIDAFRIATGEKLVEGQTVSFEAEDCVDRKGKCWLTVEKYEGRDRNKVREYVDPESEKKPPPASAVKTAPAKPASTESAAPPAPKQEPKSLAEEFGEEDEIPMQ
jgi:hypothetical protein